MAENTVGRIVTNEQTGEKAWWDGKTLSPIRVQIDPKHPGAMEDMKTLNGPMAVTNQPPPGNLPPPPDMVKRPPVRLDPAKLTTGAQILREENDPLSRGFGSMVGEAMGGVGDVAGVFQNPLNAAMGILRIGNAPAVGMGSAAGTQTQNLLAGIPGLGGAEGIIPAAGATAADLATQLITGGPIMRSLTSGAKGVARGLASIIAPGSVREGGARRAAQLVGMQPNMVTEAFTAPESRALYKAARAVPGQLPPRPLQNALLDTFDKLDAVKTIPQSARRRVDEVLNPLYNDISTGRKTYGDMVNELINIRRLGEGFLDSKIPSGPTIGHELLQARANIMRVMDNISPEFKMANDAFRREETGKVIVEAMRSGNPEIKLRNLVMYDPSIATAFPPQAMQQMEVLASRISRVAGATPDGMGRVTTGGLGEGLADMLSTEQGRAVLGVLLSPTSRTTGPALFATIKAWQAAKGQDNPGDTGADAKK